MEVVTPDSTRRALACSIMKPGNVGEGQGIYPGCEETAILQTAFCATVKRR